LYFPETPATHPAPVFSYPALHVQLATLPLPTGEVADAGQAKHSAPSADEYVPAVQLLQTVEAFAAEYLPAAQSAQV
jgi:hypothetical protein